MRAWLGTGRVQGRKRERSLSRALKKNEFAAPIGPARASAAASRIQKTPVVLLSQDDSLWSQIGAGLSDHMALKQVDSDDELLSSTRSGQAAIVIWDARGHADPASMLSGLHQHSARFVIIALDTAASAGAWKIPLEHRQIVGLIATPLNAGEVGRVLALADEDLGARVALLGDGGTSAAASGAGHGRRFSGKFLGVGALLAAAVFAGAAIVYYLQPADRASTAPAAVTPGAPLPDKLHALRAPAKPAAGSDDTVDALLEKAGQAMQERHFLDPAAGSALTLYRDALVFDPANGEARQGLQRLAEILFSRVQSNLDDRKFDLALQVLETARSIDPNTTRLAVFDARIASLRAELGSTQIQAVLNAKNYDRAGQLIDEAARAKSLSAVKLAQLREELRRRRDESELDRLAKLFDTRLQQDRLIDPRNDSAAFYLDQARQAGMSAETVQAQAQELAKRLLQAAHGAIDQRHFSDADRFLTEARNQGAANAAIAGLQHDLGVARSQQSREKSDQQQLLGLAQTRLAQGSLLDPPNDNALYYVNQLRSADPKNGGLAPVVGAVQTQLLERARAALAADQGDKAEELLRQAMDLGATADLAAFGEKIKQWHVSAGAISQVNVRSLVVVTPIKVQYPSKASELNMEGWVDLTFTVSPEGKVVNAAVVDATPPHIFDGAALSALMRARYQPVLRDGNAVSVGSKIRITFKFMR
jgi:periplasmic protein TonB